MDNLSQYSIGEMHHPPDDEFIEYVDGELAAPASAAWQTHLDACWFCRVRVTKIQETIADLIDFENTISPYRFSSEPHGWSDLGSRFAEVDGEPGRASFAAKISHLWRDVNPFQFTLPARLAASSLAVIIIAAIIYQFVLVAPLSAADLLDRAAAEQHQAASGADRGVIERRIKLTQNQRAAYLDTWSEATTAKNKRMAIPGYDSGLVREYIAVCAGNGFDPDRPLSAENYRQWRDSVPDRLDKVENSSMSDASDALRLTTTVKTAHGDGDITRAGLTVRSGDYHPVAQTLEFISAGETRNIEITEVDFHIVARDSLPANFFDTPSANTSNSTHTNVSTNTGPEAETPTSGSLPPENTNTSPPVLTSYTATASLETEVEVIKALDATGALSTGQVTVTRTAGLLHISGVVDTPQRKAEIIAALADYRTGRGVVIEIQTLEEATSRRRAKPSANIQVSTETVDVDTSLSMPVESELKAALQKRGVTPENMGREMRTVADGATSAARSIRRDALALKQIAERFSQAELDKLDPAKREEWKNVIRSRARSLAANLGTLTGQLAFLGYASQAQAAEPGTGDGAILEKAQRLFGLAAGCDADVNQSFAISATGRSTAQVRSPQFWRNLAQMSALAKNLEVTK